MRGRKIQVARSEGEVECRAALEAAIQQAGGLMKFCVASGVTGGDVSMARRERRHITTRIAAAIGWEKVIVYRKVSA